MTKTIAILGTLDTKAEEMGYLRDIIQEKGLTPLIIDAGILGDVPFPPDITREEVANAAGTTLNEIRSLHDEGKAIAFMAEGASWIMRTLSLQGHLHGIISIGGSMGTSLGLAAMRELPIGLPKLMVSTIAFTPLVTGDKVAKDQVMMQVPVDLWGLNSINTQSLQSAAHAIIGMAESYQPLIPEKPMVGVTTRGIMKYLTWMKPMLEERGYEVVVSHAIGTVGGGTFEHLIRQGFFTFVFDLCVGEMIEELNGGALRAGPDRLEAAGMMGIPQIIAPGCMEYWHWPGKVETIPKDRTMHFHNPLVLCVKATHKEMLAAAEVMAEKLNRAKGPVIILFPLLGFDDFDKPDSVFYDPEGHTIFLNVLRKNLHPKIKVIELDMHINDQAFAETAVSVFDDMIKAHTWP
jgi:uncharacterized protein (UPF0261 family)